MSQTGQRPRFPLRPSSCISVLLLIAAMLHPAAGGAAASQTPPDVLARTYVVCNSTLPESQALARHYMERRGVPPANLIALSAPAAETITWKQFVETVWEPLQDELVRRGAIDALPGSLRDDWGRRRLFIDGHSIACLVICKGIPLRFGDDPGLLARLADDRTPAQFRTMKGAVDSELCLIARMDAPVIGFVPNPLHRVAVPSRVQEEQVVKVGRLDGPTYDIAANLVDDALAVEGRGLAGIAYVDYGAGRHPDGDHWLESALRQLEFAGWPVRTHPGRGCFDILDRMDGAAVYLGWYANDANGPFLVPGMRLAQGAIAIHIHSFSAATLSSDSRGWCGPLLARGAAATIGNVYEPYLQLTPPPDLIIEALLQGAAFVDAVCYATPALGWQGVAIGDPLYRPFARRWDMMWAGRRDFPDGLVPYLHLQRIEALRRAGRTQEALRAAREAAGAHPGWVTGLALAGLLMEAGDKAGAVNSLRYSILQPGIPAGDAGLAIAGATLLQEAGEAGLAPGIHERLLANPDLPKDFEAAPLRSAIRAADLAGAPDQKAAWRKRLDVLVPPPPPAPAPQPGTPPGSQRP